MNEFARIFLETERRLTHKQKQTMIITRSYVETLLETLLQYKTESYLCYISKTFYDSWKDDEDFRQRWIDWARVYTIDKGIKVYADVDVKHTTLEPASAPLFYCVGYDPRTTRIDFLNWVLSNIELP